MSPDVLARWLPIGISSVALCVSLFGLGWNVYRDVVLKARVRVRVDISKAGHPGYDDWETYVTIVATNHGPGKVHISSLVGRVAPWWRRLTRQSRSLLIRPDFDNPLNRPLPTVLEVGERATFVLPFRADGFLAVKGLTHAGVADSYGRWHFAPRKVLRSAVARYRRDFPKTLGDSGEEAEEAQ